MNTEAAKPDVELLNQPTASGVRLGTAWLRRPGVIVAVLALVLLAWQWLETRSRMASMELILANRLSQGDSVAQEARALAKQAQESLETIQGKVGGLEAKLAESQSQLMALDAVYQEMARNRDDRVVAEVEQTLTLGAQQLHLAGNVQSALAALESVDARLAVVNRPQFLALRKAIARDMQRLKSLPMADVPGMSLKLENIMVAVDTLPLAFAAPPKAESKAGKGEQAGGLSGLGKELWGEMRQLIRVERLDRPDPGLLTPEHTFFLRENLKLRLLDARLALLQKEAKGFRDDVRQARVWLERYFDTRSPATQSALATLKQLLEVELGSESPSLNESLGALRMLRSAADKGR